MRISVIIPAFNAASTIEQTLQSVLDQTSAPYEVIVVDDGSTDRTSDVVNQFNGLPIKLLAQSNLGLGSARNSGMELATGEAYAFLDADDLWVSTKLEVAVKALRTHENTSWFYTPILEWDGENKRRRSCPKVGSIEDFLAYNPIVPSTVVMRNTLAFQWEQNRSMQEDVGAYLRLFFKGIYPRKIPQIGTLYRVDYGMTQDLDDHYLKVFEAVDNALQNGFLTETQFALYKVRKAYEAARTYKKRGDQRGRNQWKSKIKEAAKKCHIPLKLRLRIWLLA